MVVEAPPNSAARGVAGVGAIITAVIRADRQVSTQGGIGNGNDAGGADPSAATAAAAAVVIATTGWQRTFLRPCCRRRYCW